MTAITYPNHHEGNFSSARQVSYGYTSMAQLSSLQTKLGTVEEQNPPWQSVISDAQYNAFGGLSGLTHLGSAETRQYNVLGQMTRTTAAGIDYEYRFSTTQNDGKIVSQKNWQTGEDVTYQYDELERLIGAQTTNSTSWGLAWSYDGFGNRLSQAVTQGSAPINVVGVDSATNRIASSGYSNDANGNMTAMPHGAGSMYLTYDHSNRLQNAAYPGGGTEDYRYAPDNRRIWRNKGRNSCQQISDDGYIFGLQNESTYEQVIFYSPGGQKMGVYCVTFGYNPSFPGTTHAGITASEENVYFGARLVGKRMITATQLWNGRVGHFAVDRLHSRGGSAYYFPYGENKSGGKADDREQFATYTRDQSTGLDYADQRYYANGLGRFASPDPYLASADQLRPTGFNRFSYVELDPVNYYDPNGLMINAPVPSPDRNPIPGGPGNKPDLPEPMETPGDQDYNTPGSGGTTIDTSPKHLLSLGLKALRADCAQKIGNTSRLVRYADSLTFVDGRQGGNTGMAGDPNGIDFAAYPAAVFATTLLNSQGLPSKVIVLWANYFGNEAGGLPNLIVDKQVTLTHEFLHSFFKLSSHEALLKRLGIADDSNNASRSIDSWLKDCLKVR